MTELKKELIGGSVYIRELSTSVTISVENIELFRKLGMKNLFKDDIKSNKSASKPNNTNVKRVKRSANSK